MIIPSVEISRSNELSYRLQFSLHNLLESSSYEVIIQTRNKVGWSQSSDTFVFTTSGEPWGTRGQLVFAQSSRAGTVGAVPAVLYFTIFSIIMRERRWVDILCDVMYNIGQVFVTFS